MAKLQFTIEANDLASRKIDILNKKLNDLTKETIKIKVEAVGVDSVTKSAIQLANAQARLAKAEADAAKETAKKAAADARAKTATENRIAAEKRLQTQIERNKAIDKELQLQQERTSQSANKAAAEIARTGRANQDLAMQQEKTAQSANRVAVEQERTARAHQKTEQSANQLNSAYSRLGMTMMNFAKYKFFQAITRGVSDSVSEMKALDDALVTVRKVANATDAELAALSERSFEVGSKYGRSASDYASGVAEFNRAGYRETAEGLAELSIKTQLVGDMSAATANQFLLATDAAYHFGGSISSLSAVLDGMNAIDNNFATSIEKMAAGLGKVAPIAAQAHVGVDELAAALGTITAVTQRSGEEAATALRALFLNIMGDTKTEIEDGATWTAGEIEGLRDIMRQYIPEIVEEAERLGKVINPMEAIGALAQAYQEGLINEEELMKQVTDIGGKLRSSQLLAIIQNWDMYESMLNTYRSAAGSADAEVSKMMDSWSVKSEQLSTSFAKLMNNFLNADVAKGGLDALRAVVEALDSDFGRAAISSALLAAGFAGLYKAGSSLVGVFANLVNILGKMGPGGWISLAIAGAGLLIGIIDQLVIDSEELSQIADQSKQAYEQEASELEAVNNELKTAEARIAELQAKGTLTFVEQEELDRLIAATDELREQKELKEYDLRIAQEKHAFDSTEAIVGKKINKWDHDDIRSSKYGYYIPAEYDEVSDKSLKKLLKGENINYLVAAYDEANRLLADGKIEALEYNDAIYSIGETARKNSSEIDSYLAANEEYYNRLTSEKTWDEMNTKERAFLDVYSALVASSKDYKEFFSPEQFSKEYLPTLEDATKYTESYVDSLVEGSDELKNYQAAYDEMSDHLGDVHGFDTAIALAEELGRKYNLTREGVNALIQDIRVADSSLNGDQWAFPTTDVAQSGNAAQYGTGIFSWTTGEYNRLSVSLSTARDRFVHLSEAMNELNRTGRVSEYTFSMLERLGVDLGDVLYDDLTGGFIVSKDAIQEAGEATAETLNELTGSDYTFNIDTTSVDEFTASLNAAEEALSDLKQALSDVGESGDVFREYQDVYKEVMGLYGEGRTGTNAFAGYSRSLLSAGKQEEFGSDAKAIGEFLGGELISGLFEASEEGGPAVAQYLMENFGGTLEETGARFVDMGGGIGVLVSDWSKFSETVGLSENVLRSLGGFIDEYSSEMSDFGKSTEAATETVDGFSNTASQARDTLSDGLGGSSKDVQTMKVEAETEEAEAEIDGVGDKADELNGSYTMSFETDTGDSESILDNLLSTVDAISGVHVISFVTSTSGGIGSGNAFKGLPSVSLPGFAEGTEAAKSGPAIVNEKGPELIVSKGRAFIAGNGKPTIVDLDSGDIVYTNEETNELLAGRNIGNGISSHASGTYKGSISSIASSISSLFSTVVSSPSSSSKKKSSSKQSSGGSGGGTENNSDDSVSDSTDWWKIVEDNFGYLTDQQQRAINRISYQIELLENDLEDLSKPLEKEINLIDRMNDQLDRQIELLERQRESAIKPLQDQVDEMQKAKEVQDDQLELAERQKAVEEARNELQNAQNERTIRYYNAQKGQWEWMADKGRVADAEEALKDAEKNLADYEYEMQIKGLESQIEQIEGVYQDRIDEIENNQLSNDDRIYDLEQQLLALEEAYNSAIEPYEAKLTELERQLKAIEEQWAEAEMPYNKPEGDLSKALANITGTSAEKKAVSDVVGALKSVANENISSVEKAAQQTVSVMPTQTTSEQYSSILAEMGVLLGAGSSARDTSSYTNSNTTNVYDYSGAISIGGITVSADPKSTTLADLVEQVGIYV